MRIFVNLKDPDEQMMRVLASLRLELGAPPTKRQALRRFKRQHHYGSAVAKNTFRKLTLLEVVEHDSRNSHCWLTDKGVGALQGARVHDSRSPVQAR